MNKRLGAAVATFGLTAAMTASTLVFASPAEAVTDFRNCDHMHRTYKNGVAKSAPLPTDRCAPATSGRLCVRGSTGPTTRATPTTTAPPARSAADATRRQAGRLSEPAGRLVPGPGQAGPGTCGTGTAHGGPSMNRWRSRAEGASRVAGKPTAWIREQQLASALIALVVLGWTVDTAAGVDQETRRWLGQRRRRRRTGRTRSPTPQPVEDENQASGSGPGICLARRVTMRRRLPRRRNKRVAPKQSSRSQVPNPTRAPQPRTYLVTRVIDGDTIELGNGSDVRVVGIDTPEVGQCGYDAATNNMARLVLNEQVRLTMSDEDTDHYGRWLRYVNVGPVDAGLQQIKQGFAIARYDSRDGYGFHVREPRYIAADRASKRVVVPQASSGSPQQQRRRRRGLRAGLRPLRAAIPTGRGLCRRRRPDQCDWSGSARTGCRWGRRRLRVERPCLRMPPPLRCRLRSA